MWLLLASPFLGNIPMSNYSKYQTIVFDQLSYLPSQGGAVLMESAKWLVLESPRAFCLMTEF